MLIERAGRLTHGHGNFDNHRLRMLLAANDTRTAASKRGRRDHAQVQRAGSGDGTLACTRFHLNRLTASTGPFVRHYVGKR